MTTPANDQIAAELHTLNEGIGQLTKTIQVAAEALYAGQIYAARIMAAKKDCDFNEVVKSAMQFEGTICRTFLEAIK